MGRPATRRWTRLADALGETLVAGPKTNVAFLKKLCDAEGFRAGQFDTGFIDRNIDALGAVPQPLDVAGPSRLPSCSRTVASLGCRSRIQRGRRSDAGPSATALC